VAELRRLLAFWLAEPQSTQSKVADRMNTLLNPDPRVSLSPWPYFSEEEIEAAAAVLRSGAVNYWTGEEGRQFEREYAAYLGTKYAIAVANGTVALELAPRSSPRAGALSHPPVASWLWAQPRSWRMSTPPAKTSRLKTFAANSPGAQEQSSLFTLPDGRARWTPFSS
jgi:hypothetical protein